MQLAWPQLPAHTLASRARLLLSAYTMGAAGQLLVSSLPGLTTSCNHAWRVVLMVLQALPACFTKFRLYQWPSIGHDSALVWMPADHCVS
jgi:molybdopterin biosynthesis enzyme MoaB